MTKNEIKNNFQTILSEVLIKYNFKLNKQTCEFTQKTKYGWNKFRLIYYNRSVGWEVDFGMLIRIDLIEFYYHKGQFYEEKYHKTTPTIGITIEDYLKDGNNYRIILNSIVDVEKNFENTINIFYNVAIPFFEKYHSIEELDKAINVKEGKSIFSGLKYSGSLGIILAGLNNNIDFKFFEEKYREYYKIFCKGFYLKEFEDILKEVKLINPAISH